MPELVKTLLVGYLDVIESPVDDGWPQSASSAPPNANLGAWIWYLNPELPKLLKVTSWQLSLLKSWHFGLHFHSPWSCSNGGGNNSVVKITIRVILLIFFLDICSNCFIVVEMFTLCLLFLYYFTFSQLVRCLEARSAPLSALSWRADTWKPK